MLSTMIGTGWIRHSWLAGVALIAAPFASADDYRDARAELVAAYQAQDYDAMVIAARESLAARPGYPGALFNLALAQSLNDDPAASLQTLELLLAKGVDFGADEMDEFAALSELPGWAAYRQGIAALYAPVGSAGIALQLDDGHFVPEGIAVDDDGNIFLGSIRSGELLRNAELLSRRQGHWSVFGMRLDDEGGLWFASAAVAQMSDVGEDEGRTGLFRVDTESGKVTRAALLPPGDGKQLLGDLVIHDDVIFATDSLGGAVYRYDINSDVFTAIVEPGDLGSPQGLVLDEGREHLYVADYIGGLYRISLEDRVRVRVALPDAATAFGIDGLYRYGNELIAIQNGIRPHRVSAFRLSDDGLSVTSARTLLSNHEAFDEPTLGVVRGDDFYLVANSHWNRFDAENRLPEALTGPIVLILRLAPR